jgi:hypothetical protein
LLRNSVVYREFLIERAEILKHKWIESEKAGFDIGFEKALTDWITRYRAGWRASRSNPPRTDQEDQKGKKDQDHQESHEKEE